MILKKSIAFLKISKKDRPEKAVSKYQFPASSIERTIPAAPDFTKK